MRAIKLSAVPPVVWMYLTLSLYCFISMMRFVIGIDDNLSNLVWEIPVALTLSVLAGCVGLFIVAIIASITVAFLGFILHLLALVAKIANDTDTVIKTAGLMIFLGEFIKWLFDKDAKRPF